MSQIDKDGIDKTFVKISPVIREILEVITKKQGGKISARSGRYITASTTARLLSLSFEYLGINLDKTRRPLSWTGDIEKEGFYRDDPELSPQAIFESFDGGVPVGLIEFKEYGKVNLYLRMELELFNILQRVAEFWKADTNEKSGEFVISSAVPRLLLIAFRFLGIDVSYFNIPVSWTNDMELKGQYNILPEQEKDQGEESINQRPILVIPPELSSSLSQEQINQLSDLLQSSIDKAVKEALDQELVKQKQQKKQQKKQKKVTEILTKRKEAQLLYRKIRKEGQKEKVKAVGKE